MKKNDWHKYPEEKPTSEDENKYFAVTVPGSYIEPTKDKEIAMPNSQSYQIELLVLYKRKRNYSRICIMEKTQGEAKKRFDAIISRPTVKEYKVESEGFITLRSLTDEEKEYALTHTSKSGDYFVPSLYRKTHRS